MVMKKLIALFLLLTVAFTFNVNATIGKDPTDKPVVIYDEGGLTILRQGYTLIIHDGDIYLEMESWLESRFIESIVSSGSSILAYRGDGFVVDYNGDIRVLRDMDEINKLYPPLNFDHGTPLPRLIRDEVVDGDFKKAVIDAISLAKENPSSDCWNNLSGINSFYYPTVNIDGFELNMISITGGTLNFSYVPVGNRLNRGVSITIVRPEYIEVSASEYLREFVDSVKSQWREYTRGEGLVHTKHSNQIVGAVGDLRFTIHVPDKMNNFDTLRELSQQLINTAELIVFEEDGVSIFVNPDYSFTRIVPYAHTIDSAIEILCYVVGLPSKLDRCDEAFAAALIVSEDEPTADDALEILKYIAGLPSAIDRA
jgi:hypothetical protein